MHQWDFVAAEGEFRRAIELSPSDPVSRDYYARYLSVTQRPIEALAEIKRARDLDKRNPKYALTEALILFESQRYDDAEEVFSMLGRFGEDPVTGVYRGANYAANGRYKKAIRKYTEPKKRSRFVGSSSEGFSLNPFAAKKRGWIPKPNIYDYEYFDLWSNDTTTLVYLGLAYAKLGESEKSKKILSKLESTRKYVSPSKLAILYGALGEKDKAFQSLERAYNDKDFQLIHLGVDPGYKDLKADPRFLDLLERIGLRKKL